MRQEAALAHQSEPGAPSVAYERFRRNAPLEGRTHRRLARVPVDVHDAPARDQRAGETAQERRAVREVMVRVHDHREVARARRQQRVVAEPEDGRDVVEAGPAKALA